MSYEEEDTCMSYEEEDTCSSSVRASGGLGGSERALGGEFQKKVVR